MNSFNTYAKGPNMQKRNLLVVTLFTSIFLTLPVHAKDAPVKKPEVAAEPTPAAPVAPVVFEGVSLSPTSHLNTSKPAELKEVSHGIRRKKVFGIATLDVYVAQFYALTPEKIQKSEDEVLNSLSAAGPVQIKLTLMRDLSGSDITKSFKEALKENDVDLSQTVPGLSELMTEIDTLKSVKKGEVFALTADWRDGQYNIHMIKPDQTVKTIAANEMALKKLFSIWLGKPVDEKMHDLKKNLLK